MKDAQVVGRLPVVELVTVLAVVAAVQWRKHCFWHHRADVYEEVLRIFAEGPGPHPTGPGTPLRLVS